MSSSHRVVVPRMAALVIAVSVVALTVALLPQPSSAGAFTDVPPDGSHTAAIERLAGRNLLIGGDSGRFHPNRSLTRGQLATVLDRALELPDTDREARFTDTASSVHGTAIERLAAAGAVNGTTSATYEPNRQISRAQVAAILVRIDGWHRQTLDATTIALTSGTQLSTDLLGERHPDLADHHLEHELAWAATLGYLQGQPDGRLEPDRPVTRAQAASLVVRFLDRTEQPLRSAPAAVTSAIGHGAELTAEVVGLRTPRRDLRASDPVVSERDGQVIEGLAITVHDRGNAGVVIRHDDVVVRDVEIRHPDGADGVRVETDVSGARIEHSRFDAVRMAPTAVGHLRNPDGTYRNNNVGSRAIDARGQVTAHRNHILLTRSGIRLRAKGSSATENLVERLFTAADSPDGASTHGTSISLPGGNRDTVVARNRVVAGSSGGIVLYAEHGAHLRVSILDNLVVGRGEGMGIYGGRSHLSTGHYRDHRDIRIEGNRFTGSFGFPAVLGAATNSAVDLSRPGNTFVDNRWLEDGAELPARCGISQDACEQP